MQVQKNISLKNYNTFGIDVKARFFCEVTTLEELKEVMSLTEYTEKFIIGGGSNMLLVNDIDDLVIHVNLKGIQVVSENSDHVILNVMAGENWHQIVLWTIEQGYGGLENLSLIPGNVGTAPIQNIGAYGVELKDVFESCDALDVKSNDFKKFSKEECQFGYRDSYFKNRGKGRFIITSVNLKLTKKEHMLNTAYGAIEDELEKKDVEPSIKEISKAVIAIRESKLPDPRKLGNSGSFFKNPIITALEFGKFTHDYPNAPFYKVSNDVYKIPAGWLIEQCGFKGKRYGNAGVHEKQALVLVNHGGATGEEILDLAQDIMNAVYERFAIRIVPEVNIIK